MSLVAGVDPDDVIVLADRKAALARCNAAAPSRPGLHL